MRVLPSGRQTWVYLYRFDGKPRRITVGIYPGLLKVALCRAETFAEDCEEAWKWRLTTKNEQIRNN